MKDCTGIDLNSDIVLLHKRDNVCSSFSQLQGTVKDRLSQIGGGEGSGEEVWGGEGQSVCVNYCTSVTLFIVTLFKKKRVCKSKTHLPAEI